jgi:hypothetical protein
MTVLEYATEKQRPLMCFLSAGLSAKDIHKEMFPVYCGKCLSRKAVHNWVEKRGKRCADDEGVETDVRKWLRQQSIGFYAAGFDALVKRCDERIDAGLEYVENYFFFMFEYNMVEVLYPSVTYLLTPLQSRVCSINMNCQVDFALN